MFKSSIGTFDFLPDFEDSEFHATTTFTPYIEYSSDLGGICTVLADILPTRTGTVTVCLPLIR